MKGIIILEDGKAELIGDIDFEKLVDVTEQILIQLKTAMEQQKRQRALSIINSFSPEELEQLMKQRL